MQPPGRVSLCLLPTPLHRLDRASERLGIDLWIKRDDLTGFAGGGNKGRKIEFLMARILASGTQSVVTSGSVQSNFVRQLGAACKMFGIRCIAVVMQMPYPVGQAKPFGILNKDGGNVPLDDLFGVELHKVPDGTWEELEVQTIRVAEQTGSLLIPLGGGSPEAVYAFQLAAREVGHDFEHLIVPCSSGSTYVGLAMAFQGTPTKVTGISADPEPDMVDDLLELSRRAPGTPLHQVDFRTDYVGPGYGVPSEEGEQARRWLAETEGIVLDPVYTGKAFAGLLHMAKTNQLKGKVLFWHTGGLPVASAGISEPPV